MDQVIATPFCSANAALISYTFVRHVGLMLDELSSQGLELWQDERRCWRWHWVGTVFQSERGFWALGEAVVDAVVSRYPAAFDTSLMVSGCRSLITSGEFFEHWGGINIRVRRAGRFVARCDQSL